MNLSLPIKTDSRHPKGTLPIRDACINNLKHIDVDLPVGIMTVVTGVAGSGKSTLISRVLHKNTKKMLLKSTKAQLQLQIVLCLLHFLVSLMR